MGGVYTYKYDGKGNVLSVTDPMGNEQTFAWNEKNKLTSQTNAAGEKTGYDYDAKGNLVSVFQPNGNTISYFYDKLDRIELLSDNMGVIAKYTYDGNGNCPDTNTRFPTSIAWLYGPMAAGAFDVSIFFILL